MLVHSQRAVDAENTAERRASKWTTEGEGETEKPVRSSGTSGRGCREYPKTQAGVNRKGMIVPAECTGKAIFR